MELWKALQRYWWCVMLVCQAERVQQSHLIALITLIIYAARILSPTHNYREDIV